MKLYRVLYFDSAAKDDAPGGALYIPPQGTSRVDNPGEYDVCYVGDSPEGACAEVFRRAPYLAEWSSAMLRPLRSFPTQRRAIVTYDVDDVMRLCDLDDPSVLVNLGLRPSHVIVRDRAITQAWALRIFQTNDYHGVKWWSYHDSRWASIGLWDRSAIRSHDIDVLSITHPALRAAASALDIIIT